MSTNDHRAEHLANLDFAQQWLDDLSSDPVRLRQTTFSICNKLSANWQRFVHAQAEEDCVATDALKNCRRGQIERVYRADGVASPFATVECDTRFLDALTDQRNSIAHGDEPTGVTEPQLREWITALRRLNEQYGR
ncbi:hypothetical protein [Luteococcus japonicus]|uniref:hypothetical protein n=1 Tax=Luteococcus japonicus TaxID=33984 RepID=UPI000B9BCA0B|nr:hypothetical protein [Luteococcus japonicus]